MVVVTTKITMIFPTGLGMSETPSDSAAVSPSSGASASEPEHAALAKLQIELGQGLEVTTLTPGRFATAIQKNTNARHALQVIREDMTSAFILNLEPDGSATVCRGWRYVFFNDGPQVHTSEHIREQLGYRGRWEQRGRWVHLDIKLDDSVCPRVGQYSQLVPDHSPEWHLRCLPIVPRNHPTLTTPILACQLTNLEPVFGEDQPHVVPGIFPGRWLLLGAGNGLRINVVASSVGGDDAPVVRVEYSPEPVRTNAWEHPF